MVQRGLCGVNNLSTSQALSRVVEVAQGVLRPTDFGFDLVPLWISCDGPLDFALLAIDIVFITHLLSYSKLFKYIPETDCPFRINSRGVCSSEFGSRQTGHSEYVL